MKLTKTKLKQIIKEEIEKVLSEIYENPASAEAERDGRLDGREGDDQRADKWETFEGGKQLEDYYLGYSNAQEAAEHEEYHPEEEESDIDIKSQILDVIKSVNISPSTKDVGTLKMKLGELGFDEDDMDFFESQDSRIPSTLSFGGAFGWKLNLEGKCFGRGIETCLMEL